MKQFSKDSIDKRTPVPMYHQLKKLILDMIYAGELRPGDMLPTEMEISEFLGISRTTARQAIMELVMEGHLYRIKGKGTFVAEKKIVRNYKEALDTSGRFLKIEDAKASNQIFSLEFTEADEQVSGMLQVKIGEKIIYLYRLAFLNREPAALIKSYLPMECRHILEADLADRDLYSVLGERKETKPVRLLQELEVSAAGKEEAPFLAVQIGSPMQKVTSVACREDGRPVEYAVARHRGDRSLFRFETSLEI